MKSRSANKRKCREWKKKLYEKLGKGGEKKEKIKKKNGDTFKNFYSRSFSSLSSLPASENH
jgi:hypothetical protein